MGLPLGFGWTETGSPPFRWNIGFHPIGVVCYWFTPIQVEYRFPPASGAASRPDHDYCAEAPASRTPGIIAVWASQSIGYWDALLWGDAWYCSLLFARFSDLSIVWSLLPKCYNTLSNNISIFLLYILHCIMRLYPYVGTGSYTISQTWW